MAARSAPFLQPRDVAEMRRLVNLLNEESLDLDEVYEGHHELHLVLLRPAATAWDLHILERLWRAAERYIRMAFGARDADPHEHGRHGHVHGELVDVLQAGDPVAVQAAVRAHPDDNEQIARQGLAPILR